MQSSNTVRRRIVTLAIIVAVLVAIPVAVSATDVFSDVADGDWAHDDITWLADKGLTKGCDTDLYCPDSNVTRREIAAFTHREQVLLGTRYGEDWAQGTLEDDTFTLMNTVNITAPGDGGALSITGFLSVLEGTGSQIGLVWTEFDNGGLCNSFNQATWVGVWATELVGSASASTVGGGGVDAGAHRVDLCAWALGDTSDTASELEVLWIAAGASGGDFGVSSVRARSNIDDNMALIRSR